MITVFLISTLLVSSAICETDKDWIWKGSEVVVYEEFNVNSSLLLCYISGKIFTEYGFQNLLSFRAALDDAKVLPKGLTVGYIIAQSLNEHTSHVNTIMEILHKYPKIVAFVDKFNILDVIQSAAFVTAIRMPTFTCSSSIKIDELLKVKNHEYMIRITSIRSVQMNSTIPSILDELGANIVSIVYEQGKKLEFGKLSQEFSFRENRVDVKDQLLLGKNLSGSAVDEIMDRIFTHEPNHEKRILTIIFLVSGSTFARIVEHLAAQKKLSHVLMVTDSSGCRSEADFQSNVRALTTQNVYIIRLCQTKFDVPEVMDYMNRYQIYKQKNEKTVNCSKVMANWLRSDANQTPCIASGEMECKSAAKLCFKLESNRTSRYNHRIYYAVQKILKSFENINDTVVKAVEDIANRTFKDIMFKANSLVGNLIYEGFHEESSIEILVSDYEVIYDADGAYSKRTKKWTLGGNNTEFADMMREIKSEITAKNNRYLSCSQACDKGYKVVLDRTFRNCWKCVPCVGNTYTENGNQSTCTECNSSSTFLWVNENKTTCDQPARSVDISTSAGKAIWFIASLNITILVFIIVVYIKYWRSRVITSSERGLSCVMLVGILIGDIESMLIATEPTPITCFLVQVFCYPFIMLTICPLLVKTFRKWLVFNFSVKAGNKLKRYINHWVTMVECLFLMIPLLLLLLSGLLLDDYKFKMNYEEESLDPVVVTKSCVTGDFTIMMASIAYTTLLLVISSLLGWNCRNLPANYREATRIFITSVISLILIGVYVPAKIAVAGFAQVALLAGMVSAISMTLTLLIFIPKVYVVLFMTENHTQQNEMFQVRHSSAPEPEQERLQ